MRPTISSCDGERTRVTKFLISHCQENPLVRSQVPVPQTDTGRRGENPKVSGTTLVKELGKMTPSLREKGCDSDREAAANRRKRLFNKNIGLCEAARRCIGADTCPVLEG